MGEDPGDHGGIGDHGNDPHQFPAPGTGERVYLENPAEQLVVRLAPPPRVMMAWAGSHHRAAIVG